MDIGTTAETAYSWEECIEMQIKFWVNFGLYMAIYHPTLLKKRAI